MNAEIILVIKWNIPCRHIFHRPAMANIANCLCAFPHFPVASFLLVEQLIRGEVLRLLIVFNAYSRKFLAMTKQEFKPSSNYSRMH